MFFSFGQGAWASPRAAQAASHCTQHHTAATAHHSVVPQKLRPCIFQKKTAVRNMTFQFLSRYEGYRKSDKQLHTIFSSWPEGWVRDGQAAGLGCSWGPWSSECIQGPGCRVLAPRLTETPEVILFSINWPRMFSIAILALDLKSHTEKWHTPKWRHVPSTAGTCPSTTYLSQGSRKAGYSTLHSVGCQKESSFSLMTD